MATPAFSYAQAAKGQTAKSVSSAASTTAPSKTASGANTPAKDALSPATIPPASGTNWADDVTSNDNSDGQQIEKQNNTREKKANNAPPKSTSQNQSTVTGVSSPELGTTSSSSTNMDDVSSLPNASSESTWENKSQASNTPDKAAEGNDQKSNKGKPKDPDKIALPSVLHPAPMPTVNIWKQRADEAAKAKASKTTATKPASVGSVSVTPIGLSQGPDVARKKSKGPAATDIKEKSLPNAPRTKIGEDEKLNQSRNNTGLVDNDKGRRGAKSRAPEKESQSNANVPTSPLVRDQELWPTPETAVDEERKKAQEKSEKSEKDRSQAASSRPHGRKEWNAMTITPNIIFQTPLPNTAPARRGGRGPGRGGASTGGRGSSYGTGPSSTEKDASSSSAIPNGEQNRRGRSEGASGRDSSPLKGRRVISSGSPVAKDSSVVESFAEKAAKDSVTQEPDVSSRKSSAIAEPPSAQSDQNIIYPRQYSSKGPKGRRGDIPSQTERRNGELVSPIKENNASFDWRTLAVAHSETAEGDIQSAHAKQSNDRRPFGSFSGRERTRGSARGGRGGGHGFQNGHHQYANGQQPLHASTFPLPRSPTAFNPDQGTYFAPSPAPNRSHRGNGPRSQSVTTDSMYRPAAYPGGAQPIAPIQTYIGGMYDYPMPPMSAVPYSPFVDQVTLFNMVSTQLEYYFSVENLCKDIFLRKHMDSKGFVFLSFIADFNRIKNLTTDMELIKLVCYQSQAIEFQVGIDGKERLRRRDGWDQWVMNKPDRDPSAQNDGSEEMYNPPVPHPQGFESQGVPRYPDAPAIHDAPFRPMNGVHPSDLANGQPTNGAPAPLDQANGTHPLPAINGEPDAFSDAQVETLSVIVRKQDQVQPPLPPSATRTFSNGSIDSRSGVLEEDKSKVQHPSLKVNGTGPSLGVDGKLQEEPRRSSSPLSMPVRLYWVKGKENPVESLPPESTYEFYTHLRSKALERRQSAPVDTCPYDMNVLYQFWSHFLIRNFNTRMYDEFRYFAFEDASQKSSDVGLNNLIKFYGESLSSKQNLIRERVARHYVDLVLTERFEEGRPAFKQLRSAWRNGALDLKNRKRISQYIDEELRASLEQ